MRLLAVFCRALVAGILGGTLTGALAATGVILVGGIGSGEPLALLYALYAGLYGAIVGSAAGVAAGVLFGLGMLPLVGLLEGARRRARVGGGLVGLVASAVFVTVLHVLGMSGAWWWLFAVPALVGGSVTGVWRGPWVVDGTVAAPAE